MVITTKEMYSEVYGILKALGDKYINKLPNTVLKVITESKEENYNPEYSMSIPLKEQKINRKSLAMIALLHYNYWCETEEDRVKLKDILETNEEKHQKKMKEKYSNDKIFSKATTKIEEKTISEKVDLSEDIYFNVDHRIYVNIDNENVYKLAHKLVEKFGEKNLPFYFKFEDFNNRKDGFVIYSDTKNLTKYIECLDEVYSENKELRMSTYSPLMFGGRISDYYSIGDEPSVENKSCSFNSLRADCIDDAMKITIRRWMYENQNIELKRNNKVFKFKDYMTDKIVDLLINDIYSEENKYKNYHNLHENAFSSRNIGELKKSLKLGVDGYINGKKLEPMKVYEERDKTSKSQGKFGIGINHMKNTRQNFLGSVSPSIIDELIKVELGNKIIHKFADCSGYFKYYLMDELRKNNIDVNKSCFNIGTQEKFENPIYIIG